MRKVLYISLRQLPPRLVRVLLVYYLLYILYYILCIIYYSIVYHRILCFIEGSLEVKLPTIWTDEKHSRQEAERRERLEERRVRRKKMQMRERVGKSRNTVFFQ